MHATHLMFAGLEDLIRAPLTFFLRPLVPGFCPSKGFVWTSLAAMFGWGVMLVPTGCVRDLLHCVYVD